MARVAFRGATPLVGHLHIIGGGLAGLSCAVEARRRGAGVTVYEAAPRAGGRCRSVDDPVLHRRIDNGSHLVLSGNVHALAYLERIGGRDGLQAAEPPGFAMLDMDSGRRWSVRAGAAGWRDAGLGLRDALGLLRLAVLGHDRPVSALFSPDAPSMARFWRPLVTAVLNTPPEMASAKLLRQTLLELLTQGTEGMQPLLAHEGLSTAFIDPALAWLARHGARVRLGTRIDGLARSGNRIAALKRGDRARPLGRNEAVVLAMPPDAAAKLLPGMLPALPSNPIVNAHFAVPEDMGLPGGVPFLGLLGGTAEWLFHRPGLISATVSAGTAWVDRNAAEIADAVWADVADVCRTEITRPPVRIVKERRGTIRQDPRTARRRPGCRTALANLLLAGDWTNTGLPATIEGAVLSGVRAAEAALDAG